MRKRENMLTKMLRSATIALASFQAYQPISEAEIGQSNLILQRDTFTDKSTTGILYHDEDSNGKIDAGEPIVAHTLELPWKNNQRRESCIPTGDYEVIPRNAKESGRYKYPHFYVTGVLDRSYILIHRGNKPTDTTGCILLGKSRSKDWVSSSKYALNSLRLKFPRGFKLKIIKK